MEEPIYAVVDLETTSTNIETGKLIQFGCVFVQNQQIIGSYATDINPAEIIPERITELTGIDNNKVKNAPFFQEIAEEIYQQLENKVFVAHNVNFDFKFLNHQLQEVGLQPLKIPAIDTVELTRIFYPTLNSYKLQDLATTFNLYHQNPHQADSDAYVTAELFIQITNKIKRLPNILLNKIIYRGKLLSFQTRQYLKLLNKNINNDLSDDLDNLHNICIKKNNVSSEVKSNNKQSLVLREKQKDMIQMMDQSFKNDIPNVLIEAPTGMGKTIAYLISCYNHLSKNNPVVVSTSSLVLQDQLMSEISNLQKRGYQDFNPLVLKSAKHYLNLEYFLESLNNPDLGYNARIIQMKILVWLTETTTGDLDELQLDLRNPYVESIQHPGLDKINHNSKVYKYDFLNKCYQKIANSNVLIVNHAFLLSEKYRITPLLEHAKILILDEAHQFMELFQKSAEYQINIKTFKYLAKQLRKELAIMDVDIDKKLDRCLNHYQYEIQNYEQLIIDKYQLDSNDGDQIVVPNFKEMTGEENKIRELLKSLSAELTWLLQQLTKKSLNSYIYQIISEMQIFIDYFYVYLSNTKTIYREIRKYNDQLYLAILDIYKLNLEKQSWFNHFEKRFFIGSTLLIDEKSDYFKQTLHLKQFISYQINTGWQYLGKVYVLTDQKPNQNWYDEDQLSEFLKQLVKLKRSSKILCLMTSTEQLSYVYEKLSLEENDFLTLAQGLTGSKTKNLEQFSQANRAILLGTDLMWEGIDLAGDTLQTVVIAKLPFRPPTENFEQYKAKYLKSIGKNSFYDDALPRAMMKIKQGFGRLYRSPDDFGNLIILDQRFVKSRYAKKIRQALPQNVEIEEGNMQMCLDDLSK